MSSLNISDSMINEIRLVLAKHDHEIETDPVRMLQYLSAVISVVTSELEASENQLKSLLSQLLQFTEQVFEQQLREKFDTPGRQEPVYGVWSPDVKPLAK